MSARDPKATRQRAGEAGHTYVEVLIVIVILTLALIPALDGLQIGLQQARANVSMTEADFHLVSRVEELLALPFALLDTEAVSVGNPNVATSFSDAPGSADRRLVYLARYDGDDADADADPFTGGDDGLLWVRVALENTDRAIETLTAP